MGSKPRKRCGGIVGMEQFSGMLIVRDGIYEGRCEVCGHRVELTRGQLVRRAKPALGGGQQITCNQPGQPRGAK